MKFKKSNYDLEILNHKTEPIKSLLTRVGKRLILGKEPLLEDAEDYCYEKNEDTRSQDDEWRDFIKYGKFPFLIGSFYAMLVLHIVISIFLYIYAVIYMTPGLLNRSVISIVFWCLLPFGIWIWSTMYTYWNYWKRKLFTLRLCIFELLILISQQVAGFMYRPVGLLLSIIPINNSINESMVINLGRFLLLFTSLGVAIVVGIKFFQIINEKDSKENILYFKLRRGQDFRKHKEFKYDFKVIRYMDTGKPYVVKEKDRTLHTFADGTTGTAKTSSVLGPAIADDMDQKVHNEDYQKKECLKEIKKGNFRILRSFNDADFSINYIEPVLQEGNHNINRKRQERYDFLKYISQSAGITVVAPNEAFADEVYEMAKKRQLKVNRVDPILTETEEQKPGFVGFNPIYISPLLKGTARDVDITNKANIFADILQALYEMSGAGDAYFISLNQSVTIATCKLLMLTYPDLHNGNQPDPSDVQRNINDFNLMKPYLYKLVDKYGKKQQLNINDRVAADASAQNVDCGIWQDVYTLINNDLLGPNQDAMTDRANGLRLQINNFINHPLIRRVFCAKKTLDLDRALANGEIIIVNYALELGKSVSMAFGLFFLLSYSKACLRRPGTEDSRILNLNYIDELPVLIHPELEQFFTLFRQYKVANTVALQTLDQMDKSPITKYLKGILLGNCAHQIIFGRVSPTEMDIYEKMAGKTPDVLKQETISQTSITSENPSYSYSTRETRQLANLLEGSDFRYRDFQEVTFFTVDEGSPVPPFVGRVNFLPAARRKGTPRIVINWETYCPKEQEMEPVTIHTPPIQFKFEKSGYIDRDYDQEKKVVRFTAKGVVWITSVNKDHDQVQQQLMNDNTTILDKTGGVSVDFVEIVEETPHVDTGDPIEGADASEDKKEKDLDYITLEDLVKMANDL